MRRIIYFTAVFPLVFSLIPLTVYPPASVQAVSNWVKSPITFDSYQRYILDCTVIKDEINYKMWYTHLKIDVGLDILFNSLKGLNLGNILTAFQSYQFNDFLNSLSDLNIPESTTALWTILNGMRTVIGYAESPDGKAWTVIDDNIFDTDGNLLNNSIGFPSVIKIDATTYQMWYTSFKSTLDQSALQNIFTDMGGTDLDRSGAFDTLLNSTTTVIEYVTSTDSGATWSVPSIALDISGGAWNLFDIAGSPSVIRESTTDYKMWFTRLETDFDSAALSNILTEVRDGTADISDIIAGILDSTALVIGYATSVDSGVSFTIEENRVLPDHVTILTPTFWQSCTDPFVIKSDSVYKMYFTNGTSDLDQASEIQGVLDVIIDLDPSAIWTSLQSDSFADFINNIRNLDFTDLTTVLSNTSTTIGYASSAEGKDWLMESTSDLLGSATTPWSGVSAPTYMKTSSTLTEIWFSSGIVDLTWQNIADRILGVNPGISYASITIGGSTGGSTGGTTGGGGGSAPPPGVTSVVDKVMTSGLFADDVTACSGDKKCCVTILKGTTGLQPGGIALEQISIIPLEAPPDLPPDMVGIGQFFEISPSFTTFDYMVTISFDYRDWALPSGISETDIIIVWGDNSGKWYKADSTVDVGEKVVKARIKHFTPFGLVVPYTAIGNFTTTDLTISPSTVQVNEPATISILVTNTSSETKSFNVDLEIDKTVEDSKMVSLEGGASQTVTFTVSKSEAGAYDIVIGNAKGTLTVTEATITTPPPATKFTTSYLSVTPSRIKTGETATVSVMVTNTGSSGGAYTVILKINSIDEQFFNIDNLAAGESQSVTFYFSKNQPGTYSIGIDNLSASVVVQSSVQPTTTTPPPIDKQGSTNWLIIVGGILSGVIGFILTFMSMRYILKPVTFDISNITIVPSAVKPGATAMVTVKITNTGNRQGAYTAVLKVNNVSENSRELILPKGGSETVYFTVVRNNPGIYVISIGALSGRLVVRDSTGTS